MTLREVSTLADLLGEWMLIQKLLFAFLQFSFFVCGWQTFELIFLIPDVKIGCNAQDFNDTNVTTCSSECSNIKYEHDVFKATLTEELGLACSRSWLKSFTFTLISISAIVGNLSSGEMADRIGRQKTILVLLVPFLLGISLVYFPWSYAIFAVGECLIGMSMSSISRLSYILLFEFCGTSQKEIVGVTVNIGYSFGVITVGVVTWAIRHWLYLHIITTIIVAVLAVVGFLPESVDWLIKKGKTDEAFKTTRKIIQLNKRLKLSDSEIQQAVQQLSEQYKSEKSSENNSTSFMDLIVKPEYRVKTFFACFSWFTGALVYLGVSVNVDVFGNDLFLSFILSATSSLPLVIILIALLKILCIKRMILGCCTLIALTCFLYVIEEVYLSSRTPLTVLSWGFSMLPYLLIYAYTAQMFPTEMRGKALGIAGCAGRLGGAVAPFAKELANATKDYVPMLIFGVMYLILALLVMKLDYSAKETKSTKEESERLPDHLALNATKKISFSCVTDACNSNAIERF